MAQSTTIYAMAACTSMALLAVLAIVLTSELRTLRLHVEMNDSKRDKERHELENETRNLKQQLVRLMNENNEERPAAVKTDNNSKKRQEMNVTVRREVECWNENQVMEWVKATINDVMPNSGLAESTAVLFAMVNGKQFVELIVDDAHNLSINDRLFFMGCHGEVIPVVVKAAESLLGV